MSPAHPPTGSAAALMQLKTTKLLRLAELAETEGALAEGKAAQLRKRRRCCNSPVSRSAKPRRWGLAWPREPAAGPIARVVTSVVAVPTGHVSDGGPLVRIVGR